MEAASALFYYYTTKDGSSTIPLTIQCKESTNSGSVSRSAFAPGRTVNNDRKRRLFYLRSNANSRRGPLTYSYSSVAQYPRTDFFGTNNCGFVFAMTASTMIVNAPVAKALTPFMTME